MPKLKRSYTVQVDRPGCEHCTAGRLYMVIDPDGVGEGISYSEKADAIEQARDLTTAYRKGVNDGLTNTQLTDRAVKASRELMSFLNVRFPRGVAFANNLEQTIAICIEQNMKGVHRA